ncbi:MAG TPA: glycosyltransferase [Alphaproteobacteria bacterium]
MKILIVNYSDKMGGAARATWRLYQAMRRHNQDDIIRYAVIEKTSAGDDNIITPSPTHKLNWLQEKELKFRQRHIFKNKTYHSLNLFSSPMLKLINDEKPDIIHLHWIGNNTLSIRDLSKLKAKTIFWTLHDEWALHGAEHYHDSDHPDAYVDGYKSLPKPDKDRSINRFVWLLKKFYYIFLNRKLHLLVPSKWMHSRVLKNRILKPKSMHVLPYALDILTFKPRDKIQSRRNHNLPLDKKIILFGADTADAVPAKGYHELTEAIAKLKDYISTDEHVICIFGHTFNPVSQLHGFPVIYTGHIDDDQKLSEIYSAADIMVVPSLIDNAPQTVTESLACGTPVVAFRTCGLPDYITHEKTGYLAQAFDTDDLARGIAYLLKNEHGMKNDCVQSVSDFSYDKISEQRQALYHSAL